MINILESSQNFFIHFEKLVENLLANFLCYLKYDGQNEALIMKKQNQIKIAEIHTGISKRKEMIRKTNLFDEYEIKSLFKNMMQVLFY